jgi:hypothetical protein
MMNEMRVVRVNTNGNTTFDELKCWLASVPLEAGKLSSSDGGATR